MVQGIPGTPRKEPDDLEFLKRGLLLGEGFQLYLVGVNSVDGRRRVADEIASVPGLHVTAIEGASLGARTLVTAVIDAFSRPAEAGKYPVVIVSEIDENVAEEPRLLMRLNQQRNQLTTQASGALILLGSQYLIQRLRSTAPDLWSIRAADLELHETSAGQELGREDAHLSPIEPPHTGNEHHELLTYINEQPAGDSRGRAILRLAEICQFVGYSPARIATLYTDAAHQITDVWLSALARINAGISFTRARQYQEATGALLKAKERLEDLGPGFKGWFHRVSAELDAITGKLEHAFKSYRTALHFAHISGDLDLLSETRRLYASLHLEAGNNQKAMEEAKVAEQEALRAGNRESLRQIRAFLGSAAVSAGYMREARSAWIRYLQQREKDERATFAHVLAEISRMQKKSETVAVDKALKLLEAIAEENGFLSFLTSDVTTFCWDLILWGRNNDDITIWFDFLTGIINEKNTGNKSKANLSLLAARRACEIGDYDSAGSLLEEYGNLCDGKTVSFFHMMSKLLMAALVMLKGSPQGGVEIFAELVENPERRQLVTSYLARQSRRFDNLDQLPEIEKIAINLMLHWLGGQKSIPDILDIVTLATGPGGANSRVLENSSFLNLNTKIVRNLDISPLLDTPLK